jgi:PLD-like domain
MSTMDAFLAPVMTEVLLTALARLRSGVGPATLWIGSPWLSDLPLFPGIFAGSFPYLLPGVTGVDVASLSDFLGTWRRDGGQATLLVQGYAPSNTPTKREARLNEVELVLLERCMEVGVEVLFANAFHDKFLVVTDVVVSGSANVTYSGFYRNRERLTLHTRSSSPQDYASALTVCENHLVAARSAGPCQPPRAGAGIATSDTLREVRRSYGSSWK